MLARRARLSLLGLGLGLGCGCGCADEVPQPEQPPPIEGELLAHVVPGLCGPCWDYELISSPDELIQLRVERDNEFLQLSRGDPKPGVSQELAELRAAVEAGIAAGEIDPDEPSCSIIDAGWIRLFVGEHELVYPPSCPPAGVEELDALIVAMISDLVYCTASARLSPKIGCEPIDFSGD